MRRFVTMVLVLQLATGAFGASGNDGKYVGGSAPGLNPGDSGVFDTTRPKGVVFASQGKQLSIACDRIRKVEYRREVLHHLGVAPAIAVGLIMQQLKRHLIIVTYDDEAGDRQVAIFEVSRSVPQPMLAVVAARAPQACVIAPGYLPCPLSAARPVTNATKP